MNEEHNAKHAPRQWAKKEEVTAADNVIKAIALERKPRGKKAREFYLIVGCLVQEADYLREIKGNKARARQVAIGEELALYKYPACNDMWEYDMAQSAGEWEMIAKQGGEYYPQAQYDAEMKAQVDDMLTDDCAHGDMTVIELAEKIGCSVDDAKERVSKAKTWATSDEYQEIKTQAQSVIDEIPF